jgi:hypothetical protein
MSDQQHKDAAGEAPASAAEGRTLVERLRKVADASEQWAGYGQKTLTMSHAELAALLREAADALSLQAASQTSGYYLTAKDFCPACGRNYGEKPLREAAAAVVLRPSPESKEHNVKLTLFVWKCASCGCLWRDNLDGTVSLLDAEQHSCAECEFKPTAPPTCQPFAMNVQADV